MKALLKMGALALLLAPAGACVVRSAEVRYTGSTDYDMGATTSEVYVEGEPPAPIIEVRPAPPSSYHVWLGGYHYWNGRSYAWVPGRWSQRPSHVHSRASWVAPHWERRGRGHVWISGRWRN